MTFKHFSPRGVDRREGGKGVEGPGGQGVVYLEGEVTQVCGSAPAPASCVPSSGGQSHLLQKERRRPAGFTTHAYFNTTVDKRSKLRPLLPSIFPFYLLFLKYLFHFD